MKYELPCAVVRDLLPSYIEGLTETETTAAVQDHLENCDDCRKKYEAMKDGETEAAANEKEVDYLKTVRRKNWKKVILAAALAVVLVLSSVAVCAFHIGSPSTGSGVSVETVQKGDTVSVSCTNLDSATTLVGWKMETVEDTVYITARKVLASPLHTSALPAVMEVDTAGITKIVAFGRLIWQDGLTIDSHTNRLLEDRIPYVGNAPALGKLISAMDLGYPYTLELQTAKEPYGVTLNFTQPIDENRRFLIEGNAYVLLTLVDNLGRVSWNDPSGYSDALTLDEANAAIPRLVEAYNAAHGTNILSLESVKDYGTGSYELQLLQNILGI